VQRAFDPSCAKGQIHSVEVNRSCSILACRRRHGGRTRRLGAGVQRPRKAGVNVRAIAQGASERNISVVIDAAAVPGRCGPCTSSFYLSAHTVSIGLIGPGLVGGALLDQIASQVERLRRDFKLDLRVRGIAGSKRMRLVPGQVDLARWRDAYATARIRSTSIASPSTCMPTSSRTP